MGRLTIRGFLGRFATAFVLVVLTYNPTGYSYINWVTSNFPHLQPMQAILGLLLLAGWVFFLHATWRSLGMLGVCFAVLFFAAIVWLLHSWGWLNSPSSLLITWLVLLVVSVVLTIGVCWGLIRARVSGQPVIEEVQR
jgi:hypothetical protein